MSTKPFVIIQARLASTRLPEKIILDFYDGKGILEIILERIKQVIPVDQIIVATSEANPNDSIQQITARAGVKCFAGSEDNVLKRFIDAASKYGAEKIIRVCSDNPFLDIQELKRIYDAALNFESDIDYASFWIDGKPSILTHYGLWTEYTNIAVLKRVTETTDDTLYLEHVTNYIHSHRDMFNIEWLQPSIKLLDSVRLTTDTKNDFLVQKLIFNQVISKFGIEFTTNNVMTFLSENNEYITTMHNEIINNGK